MVLYSGRYFVDYISDPRDTNHKMDQSDNHCIPNSYYNSPTAQNITGKENRPLVNVQIVHWLIAKLFIIQKKL